MEFHTFLFLNIFSLFLLDKKEPNLPAGRQEMSPEKDYIPFSGVLLWLRLW